MYCIRKKYDWAVAGISEHCFRKHHPSAFGGQPLQGRGLKSGIPIPTHCSLTTALLLYAIMEIIKSAKEAASWLFEGNVR